MPKHKHRIGPALPELVGFNYSLAAVHLLQVFSYEALAEAIGYQSKASISDLLDGKMPAHVHGEALWALYLETFGRKPPLTDIQQNGAV